MPNILVDAGPLIALFSRRDHFHKRAVTFLQASEAKLVTTTPIVTEVMLALEPSLGAQTGFLRWAHAALDIDTGLVEDLPRIIEVMEKYSDLPADFADASLVSLAERIGIKDVATIDNDFSVYRIKGKQRFINVFPDA